MKKLVHQQNQNIDLKSVYIRERFTNVLVRIAIHKKNGTSDESNMEFNALTEEVRRTLILNPDWKDIANTWMK